MYFITAFPDDYYFSWQLEIQLLNFYRLGIPKDSIHVLIGYNPRRGLRHYFSDLINRQQDKAMFFVYPDTAGQRRYIPSIRPFLMHTHLNNNPFLTKEMLFYYDTDIIFSRLPDFNRLSQDDNWYVSDTRNYIGTFYIKGSGGDKLLNAMCEVVGIPVDVVEKNDFAAGGAQYLFKHVSVGFWKKVEADCEALFLLMNEYNYDKGDEDYMLKKGRRSQYRGIQAWCADMWAVLWNAWLQGTETRIDQELDFCWTNEEIAGWQAKPILHYSGSIKEGDLRFFRKSDYTHIAPYYEINLKEISPDFCSYPLAGLIDDHRKSLDQERTDLTDTTFLIMLPENMEDGWLNFEMTCRYISKFVYTNLLITHFQELNAIQKEVLRKLENGLAFKKMVVQRCSKMEKPLVDTAFVFAADIDVVISMDLIGRVIQELRQGVAAIRIGVQSVKRVDSIFKGIFNKLLDYRLFQMNTNKFPDHDSFDREIIFCQRAWYYESESERIKPESISVLEDELDLFVLPGSVKSN